MSFYGSSDISIDVAVGSASIVRKSSGLTVLVYHIHHICFHAFAFATSSKTLNVQIMRNDTHFRDLVVGYTLRGEIGRA